MFMGEQAITGAIKYVTSETIPTVYFIDATAKESWSRITHIFKKLLRTTAMKSRNSTLQGRKSARRHHCIVFCTSHQDLSVAERDKVLDYLKGGGNAIFLFDRRMMMRGSIISTEC